MKKIIAAVIVLLGLALGAYQYYQSSNQVTVPAQSELFVPELNENGNNNSF